MDTLPWVDDEALAGLVAADLVAHLARRAGPLTGSVYAVPGRGSLSGRRKRLR